jgi:hypothetical protein
MIEPLFDNDKARWGTRHAATPKLSTASIRRCSCRSPDRLSRRAGMAAISRGAMTSATLPSRKGLIVGIGGVDLPRGYRTVAAEQLAGHRAGQRGVGACRETCVLQARAPSGVVVAATSQVPGVARLGECAVLRPAPASMRADRNGGSAGPGTARGAGPVPGRSSRDRTGGLGVEPDDVAVAGVVEPGRHVVVVHVAGVRASAV